LPAPENAYSIAYAIDEALKAKKNNEEKIVVFNMSEHGFADLSAYQRVFF